MRPREMYTSILVDVLYSLCIVSSTAAACLMLFYSSGSLWIILC